MIVTSTSRLPSHLRLTLEVCVSRAKGDMRTKESERLINKIIFAFLLHCFLPLVFARRHTTQLLSSLPLSLTLPSISLDRGTDSSCRGKEAVANTSATRIHRRISFPNERRCDLLAPTSLFSFSPVFLPRTLSVSHSCCHQLSSSTAADAAVMFIMFMMFINFTRNH